MSEFIMGGIISFGGNFAPKDWGFCNGQLIAISQNQALYAILGTTWGGDGRTNFALPNMQSRVPIGVGRGEGLTEVRQGQELGREIHTLNVAELPTHSHTATFIGIGTPITPISATATLKASKGNGDNLEPQTGDYLGQSKSGRNDGFPYFTSDKNVNQLVDLGKGSIDVTVTGGGGLSGGTVAINATGSSRAFSIMQPNLGMQYIIALQGIFPARN